MTVTVNMSFTVSERRRRVLWETVTEGRRLPRVCATTFFLYICVRQH